MADRPTQPLTHSFTQLLSLSDATLMSGPFNIWQMDQLTHPLSVTHTHCSMYITLTHTYYTHTHSHMLTCSLTVSHTCSFTHSLTHPAIHPPTDWPTQPPTQFTLTPTGRLPLCGEIRCTCSSLTHSFLLTHSLSLTHLLIHLHTHSLTLSSAWGQMSRLMTKPTKLLCAQRRLRSAWAFAQSDQSLCFALNG